MKSFEEYVASGIVKKHSPDKLRANSLNEDAEMAYDSIKEIIEKVGINDKNPNTIIKGSYDIIMQLIRSKMFFDGYNSSGQGAHEAEVSYLEVLEYDEKDVQFLNQLRYFRNGIAYYGKSFEKDYAEKVVEFLDKIYPKLKNEVSKLQLGEDSKERKE